MKKTIQLLLFVLAFATTKAQTLDNSITTTYSKSIILKVYDVAIKTTLSVADQQNLADLFQDEENDLATLVLNGASASVVDSVKNLYKSEFNTLLSATQLADYYNHSVAAKSNTTGRLMGAMLRNKYNADATMEQYFNDINKWREEAIEKIWLRTIDTPARNTQLANAMYVYDSLLSVYNNAAASGNYFANRVYNLDSIQPIDSLKKLALGSTYYSYCVNFKNYSYADNFNAAINSIFNNVTDSPYYVFLYKDEIKQTAKNNATNAVANYIKRDKISSYTALQIAPILLQQERLKAIINKIYPTYTAAKDSIIDTLTIVYQNQIDSLVASSGSNINPSQIGIAIKYATELGLTQTQVATLTTKLTELIGLQNEFKIANPESEYDSKAFESDVLNSVLHQEQYTQVLTLKFNAIAINLANTDWSELIRLELSSQYDIEPTKEALKNYHLAVLIAYYRNAYNIELQYSSVRSINEIMPDAMRVLLEHWNYNTPYNDTPDTFFQW